VFYFLGHRYCIGVLPADGAGEARQAKRARLKFTTALGIGPLPRELEALRSLDYHRGRGVAGDMPARKDDCFRSFQRGKSTHWRLSAGQVAAVNAA